MRSPPIATAGHESSADDCSVAIATSTVQIPVKKVAEALAVRDAEVAVEGVEQDDRGLA
ncbi:MAG: hypothetical protein MSC30_15730 [Gaiellaceae bacterium MAG52_C11]|nr:hypothetical protein [Candidatus Gaiellasilicea maunaloa]